MVIVRLLIAMRDDIFISTTKKNLTILIERKKFCCINFNLQEDEKYRIKPKVKFYFFYFFLLILKSLKQFYHQILFILKL